MKHDTSQSGKKIKLTNSSVNKSGSEKTKEEKTLPEKSNSTENDVSVSIIVSYKL